LEKSAMQTTSETVHRFTPLVAIFDEPALGAQRVTVSAGNAIFEPDQPADSLYLIQRGQVRLYQPGPDGSQRLVEILGPGQWFGVASLAGSGQHGIRALAVGPTVLSEVTAERLMDALSQRPDLLSALARELAEKVQAARDEAAELIFKDCTNRLIETLVRFSRTAAATPIEDGVVLRITHHQLAQAVGVARETVSLALTQLRHQNLLRTGRNQLVFNPEVLKQFKSGSSNGANGSNGHSEARRVMPMDRVAWIRQTIRRVPWSTIRPVRVSLINIRPSRPLSRPSALASSPTETAPIRKTPLGPILR